MAKQDVEFVPTLEDPTVDFTIRCKGHSADDAHSKATTDASSLLSNTSTLVDRVGPPMRLSRWYSDRLRSNGNATLVGFTYVANSNQSPQDTAGHVLFADSVPEGCSLLLSSI